MRKNNMHGLLLLIVFAMTMFGCNTARDVQLPEVERQAITSEFDAYERSLVLLQEIRMEVAGMRTDLTSMSEKIEKLETRMSNRFVNHSQ